MKKIFLTSIIIVALSFASGAWAAPGDSPNDPIFVSTPEQLDAIRDGLSRYYELSNDIDLTAYLAPGGAGNAKWGTSGWLPIGTYSPESPFVGGLDGGGHKIIGLWIDRNGITGVGLFAVTRGAIIKDIGIEIAAAGIRGSASVGGLMGRQTGGGSIINCYTTGNVRGVGGNAGGLVGAQTGGNIRNSYTTGEVSGMGNIGGLVGIQDGSGESTNTIADSHSMGNVTGGSNGVSVGGLVGIQSAFSAGGVNIIINSYATGDVVGNSEVGGLVGRQNASGNGSIGRIENCYAIGNISGNAEVGGLVGIQDCYSNGISSIANSFAKGNINILATGNSTGGLVGRQSNGSITNCYATGTVKGDTRVGGLVGDHSGGASITSCYAKGNASGSSYIGGLLGYQIIGSIENSYATGNASGSNYVGGLVGGQLSTSFPVGYEIDIINTITNCYATGNVSGASNTGGLLGAQYGSSRTFSTITSCYATGNVTGNSASIGGIVGYQGGSSTNTITSSYRYQLATLNGAVVPTSDTNSEPDRKHGGIKTAIEFMTKTTYTGNSWLFVDSAPSGPWYWDDRGFPKLNMGIEDFPFPWDPLTPSTPVITINNQPAANTTVTAGSISGSLSVGASVAPSATLSYQWYSSATNSNTGGAPISGATNAGFPIPTGLAVGTYYYYCVVSAPGAISVTSNVARVTVINEPIVIPVITINTQPAANTTVTAGSISGSLSVGASVTPSATLSYQWYSSATNSNTGGASISGATNAGFPIPTGLAAGTYYYYCVVSAPGAISATSNIARVTVEECGGCNAIGYGYLVFVLFGVVSFFPWKRQ